MVYISGGSVKQKRSPWRLSIITDTMIAVLSFFQAFWQTLVSPDAHSNAMKITKKYDPPGGGSGGGGGRKPRIFGMKNITDASHTNPGCGGGG
jgi:hypothetical protein